MPLLAWLAQTRKYFLIMGTAPVRLEIHTADARREEGGIPRQAAGRGRGTGRLEAGSPDRPSLASSHSSLRFIV